MMISDELFEFHESLKIFGTAFKNSIEKAIKDSTKFHHEFELPIPAKPDVMNDTAAYKHFLELRETEKKCSENGTFCKSILFLSRKGKLSFWCFQVIFFKNPNFGNVMKKIRKLFINMNSHLKFVSSQHPTVLSIN